MSARFGAGLVPALCGRTPVGGYARSCNGQFFQQTFFERQVLGELISDPDEIFILNLLCVDTLNEFARFADTAGQFLWRPFNRVGFE